MSPIPSNTPTPSPTGLTSSGTVTSSTAAADQSMFLQLLVAQLKNQDPLQPMDSSTFVTQLAQFQQLDSTVGMAQDLTGIRSDADQFLASYDAANASGTGSNSGSNGTTQTQQS
jgi:flagellar basal-body rod modification protein FlgD